MANDHPIYTLCPILGTASAHLTRENKCHATYSCQICQHTILLAYNNVYTLHLQAWHYKIRQCHLSDMTCTKPTVSPGCQSLSAKPWNVMSCTFLQQPCSRLEQINLMYSARIMNGIPKLLHGCFCKPTDI